MRSLFYFFHTAIIERNDNVQAKLQKVQEEANTYKEALNDTLTKEKRKAELEAIVAKNGAIALYDSEDLEERIQEPVVQGQVASITEKLDDLKGDITNDITGKYQKWKHCNGIVVIVVLIFILSFLLLLSSL
jgi:hypothetical protein|tara:strand:+ start:91 stop:486 length:396 start_codon:yes stop_codon:yes gene_type:complete